MKEVRGKGGTFSRYSGRNGLLALYGSLYCTMPRIASGIFGLITQRKVQYYVVPPEHNGEFVAAMERVLEVYEMPYDPEVPVVAIP